MNRFKCPHCMQEVQVEDNMAGQTMTCPHCSKQFAIPAANNVPMAQVNGLPAQPLRPESLGMATTSMVLGIISLPVFVLLNNVFPAIIISIIAFITGIVAIIKIISSHGFLLGKGKAITGIVLGLLITVFLPILNVKAMEKKNEIICSTNLKRIGLANIMYSMDFDGYLSESLENIKPLWGNDDIKCPLATSNDDNYVLHPYKERRFQLIKNPKECLVVVCNRHKHVDIVLYADGHVDKISKQNTSQP